MSLEHTRGIRSEDFCQYLGLQFLNRLERARSFFNALGSSSLDFLDDRVPLPEVLDASVEFHEFVVAYEEGACSTDDSDSLIEVFRKGDELVVGHSLLGLRLLFAKVV
jgi:hypothetical protein